VSTCANWKPAVPLQSATSSAEKGKKAVDIDVRSQADVKVIKLRGRLNLGEAVDRMRQTFDDLLNAGQTSFVVDLAEVSMLDSSGIGLLVRCLTAAKQHSGSLKLLNPSKFSVQTLRMTGLLSLFELFDDEEKAVSSFH
jgi:anti-sigma B factor antagonist